MPPPPISCSLNCLFCFCCDQHPLHLMEIPTSDSGKIPSKNVPPFIVCFGTVLTCVSPFHEVSELSHIFTAPSSLPGYLVVHYPPPFPLAFLSNFLSNPLLPSSHPAFGKLFSIELNWLDVTFVGLFSSSRRNMFISPPPPLSSAASPNLSFSCLSTQQEIQSRPHRPLHLSTLPISSIACYSCPGHKQHQHLLQ